MSFPMADETGLLGKRLTANVANVGSLPGVDQHMLLLCCLSSKRLPTDRTGERLYSGVHPHVRVEVASSESLATGRTEHLLPGFVPHEMLLQVLLGGHAPSTNPTDEFRLVVSVLHMGFESVKVLAEMTADVTHDWRCFAVILLHVMIQGLLDLELLAASVARVIVVARVQSDVVILQSALVVALVLAHAALVHLLSMIPLDMGDQVTPKTEGLRAIDALVSVLFQVLGEVALLQEFAATVVALYTRRLLSGRSILFGYNSRTRFLRRVYVYPF